MSDFRVAAHFVCVVVALGATVLFAVAFLAGMWATAQSCAVITVFALGGAVWARHLEDEADRRLREQRGVVWERRDREAGDAL